MSATIQTQSTKDKIKEMFLSGQTLTSCGAAEAYQTSDLRKYVTMLTRSGMDIVSQWVTSSTGKRYKEYCLRQFLPKPKEEEKKEEIQTNSDREIKCGEIIAPPDVPEVKSGFSTSPIETKPFPKTLFD